MSLHIESLRLADFRSYERFQLNDLGKLTIFVGPNAIGKSNLLEAIQLTTALASFRSATTDQLLRWGCSEGRVETHMTDGKRQLQVDLLLGPGKKYRLNGKPVPAAALQDNLPAVVFNPDDLLLVKGSPSGRRAALDALGSQLSGNYRAVKQDYEKILRQRNKLLKDEVDPLFIESINDVFAVVGAQLCSYRLQIFEELRKVFPQQYRSATSSKDNVALSYRLSWEAEDFPSQGELQNNSSLNCDNIPDRATLQQMFLDMLQSVAAEERRRKRSLVGPHRDAIDFQLEGHEANKFASQGQQRSMAIAFKLAEFELIEKKRHCRPLLLLDDVMSEIDATRRAMLTERLRDAPQTFITTTNLEYFTPETLAAAQVVELPCV